MKEKATLSVEVNNLESDNQEELLKMDYLRHIA